MAGIYLQIYMSQIQVLPCSDARKHLFILTLAGLGFYAFASQMVQERLHLGCRVRRALVFHELERYRLL